MDTTTTIKQCLINAYVFNIDLKYFINHKCVKNVFKISSFHVCLMHYA